MRLVLATSPHLKLVSLALLLAPFAQAMAAPPPSLLEEQAGALLAWKATIQNPPTKLQSWGEGRNNTWERGYNTTWPCGWYGIKCSVHQASQEMVITEISIRGLRLRVMLDTLNFTALHTLTSIRLPCNQISGSFPPALTSSLPSLRHLLLQENELSGELPWQMKHLESLVLLNLSNNFFSGHIPTELGYLKKLVILEFSYNNLSGPLPPNLCVGGMLKGLIASYNNINGPLPSSLVNCRSLIRVRLERNQIEGDISMMGVYPNLVYMDMSSNNLFGQLSYDWGGCQNLKMLCISNNNLMGEIPTSMGQLYQLGLLDLSSNKLEGDIPSELGNLTELFILNLADNSFTGAIPSQLSDLIMLDTLNLSHNELNGFIPSSFQSMENLASIDVSYNELDGPVPDSKLSRGAPVQQFMHNKLLCGVVKGLPPCNSAPPSRGKRKGYKILVLATVLALESLVLVAVILMFWHEKEETKASNNNKVKQAKVFSVWSFDGANVFEKIIEATNHFSEKHCIGSGGSGSVYKAKLATCEIFAVKKIHMIEDECRVNDQVFNHEIEALVQIRHQNIVKLFGYCSSSQGTFLIYEYMERGDLANTLKDNERAIELDWRRRIYIVLDVIHALAYMHHDCLSSIVHRDITCNNIFLDLEFRACISDFGTAKILNIYGQNLTRLARTKGYVAPELAYTETVTEKCDVYSFGVFVVELLMGSHPGDLLSSLSFATNNDVCLQDLLDRRLVLPNAETTREIYCILSVATQCLEPRPSHRPTAQHVSDELSMIKVCEDQVDYLGAGITFPAL